MLLTTLIPCEVRYREDLAEVVRKLIIVSEIANLSVTVDSQPPKPTSLPEIVVDTDGVRQKFVHLDYVYSSTCPCSLELSEHARATRGQLATPHSQRSVARLSVEIEPDARCLWFEDLIEACRRAVPTETQVMVKREDEQAFAELNAANPIFVEDAARLFCEQLAADVRIGDFRVVASHQESLHSHDAVSILIEGDTFKAESLDPKLFNTLFHVG